MIHTSWYDPSTWIPGMISALVDVVSDGVSWMISGVVNLIFVVTVPSPHSLQSHWFYTGIAGFYGLALLVWKLLVVVIGVMTIVSATRTLSEKSRIRLSRLITSFLWLLAISILFFPVYGLLYHLDKSAIEAMIQYVTSKPSTDPGNTVAHVINNSLPDNLAAKLLSVVVLFLASIILLIEGGILCIAAFGTMILYPLTIALRPIGDMGNKIFNGANAVIIVTLVSPPIMIGGLLLPQAIGRIPEFPLQGIAQLGAALAGAVVAIATPIGLAFLAYKTSSQMFGRVDGSMAGAMDVNSMPPVSAMEMQQSVDDAHSSAFGEFGKAMAAGTVAAAITTDEDNSFFDNMKNVSVDAAAAGIAKTHPVAGAAVNLANDRRKSRQADGGSSSDDSPVSDDNSED